VKRSLILLSLTLGLFSNPYDIKADDEVRRYYKCYQTFVKKRPATNDSRLLQIKAGSLSGTQACAQLLQTASLTGSGDKRTIQPAQGNEVLRTFSQLHSSWFPNDRYNDSVLNGGCYSFTQDVHDSRESAHQITHALFGMNGAYSRVLLNNNFVEAVRESSLGSDRERSVMSNTVLEGRFLQRQGTNQRAVWDPRFVEAGKITGFREKQTLYLQGFRTLNGIEGDQQIEVTRSLGGGILGSRNYLVLNSGRNISEKADGGEVMHRLWAQSLYNNLLCRDLPVVRSIDAIRFVERDSHISFRQGISCMQCHSSMDGLAKGVRNASLVTASNTCDNTIGFNTVHVYRHPTSLPDLSVPTDGDSQYHLRTPRVHFYFRSAVDSRLHDQQFDNLDQLANYIVNNVEDYYTCAAKRYYRFLTGIDVPLFDQGDLSSQPISSPEMRKYHGEVLRLGREFKNHNNTMRLLQDIIGTETYLRPGQK